MEFGFGRGGFSPLFVNFTFQENYSWTRFLAIFRHGNIAECYIFCILLHQFATRILLQRVITDEASISWSDCVFPFVHCTIYESLELPLYESSTWYSLRCWLVHDHGEFTISIPFLQRGSHKCVWRFSCIQKNSSFQIAASDFLTVNGQGVSQFRDWYKSAPVDNNIVGVIHGSRVPWCQRRFTWVSCPLVSMASQTDVDPFPKYRKCLFFCWSRTNMSYNGIAIVYMYR